MKQNVFAASDEDAIMMRFDKTLKKLQKLSLLFALNISSSFSFVKSPWKEVNKQEGHEKIENKSDIVCSCLCYRNFVVVNYIVKIGPQKAVSAHR